MEHYFFAQDLIITNGLEAFYLYAFDPEVIWWIGENVTEYKYLRFVDKNTYGVILYNVIDVMAFKLRWL